MEKNLGNRETDIMNALWRLGEATVADVQAALREEGLESAYTTVQTMLNRLEAKGHVTRKLDGRAYRYRPRLRQAKAAGSALNQVIERFFGGSAEALAKHLVEEDLDRDELNRIRTLIEDRRGARRTRR